MKGLAIFFAVIILSLFFELITYEILEKIIGRPFKLNHRYTLGKSISLMAIPIWGLIALLATSHFDYALLFLLGAVVGTFSEYCFGRFFHKIEGRRVWTYQYLTSTGYTSFFSIPYWGGATLLFVLLAKLIQI
jgi:hypothetical protein